MADGGITEHAAKWTWYGAQRPYHPRPSKRWTASEDINDNPAWPNKTTNKPRLVASVHQQADGGGYPPKGD